MSVQNRADFDNVPFILSDNSLTRVDTVAQDQARSGDMVYGTLMSYNPGTQLWVPFTDETATDGTQIPKGFLLANLTEAEIQASDVVNVPILVGNAIVAKELVVVENLKSLETIVNVPANLYQSVEDILRMFGLFVESTVDIDEHENPSP